MDKISVFVLLIDDKLPMLDAFKTLFDVLHFEAELTFRQPTSQKLALGGTPMPEQRDLDVFDVALVDLELFPPKRSFSHKATDMLGGSAILPYLRKNAPWLPVIAQSYLLNGEAPHLLPMIGSFGFDGLLPQALLPSDGIEGPDASDDVHMKVLDRPHWRTIVDGALLQRRRALFGPEYAGESNVDEIDISSSVLLGSEEAPFRAALRVAFHFAKNVAIEQIAPGHSGARVFKAVVSGGEKQDARAGYWLVKTSRSPWKLQQEVSCHMAMMRGGAEYGVGVPLLWRGVVVEQRLGLIAYRFAQNTEPASKSACTAFGDIREPICSLLRSFYHGGASEGRLNRDTLLRGCGAWMPNLEAVKDQLPKAFLAFANAVLNPEDGRFAQIIEYTKCRIHGDLHLDNIMVGETPVLIDFSKSSIAALSMDAAKLASDMLLRLPDVRDGHIPQWKQSSKLFEALGSLADEFPLKNGDGQLFVDFLSVYLWEALFFESTDKSTRKWIWHALGSLAK